MSNKNLLSENTIRRFMKLAAVEPLTNEFVRNSLQEAAYAADDEEDPGMAMDAEPADEGPPPEELDLEMDDEPADLGEPPPEMEADISLTEEEARVLIELGERLSEAMGDAEEEEMEPPPEAPEDDIQAEEPPPDMEAGAPEPEGAPDELVREVLRRVTKRIIKERIN